MPCPNETRKRRVTVSFRVTPEQAAVLDALVAASGMPKQDYIVANLTDVALAVQPNVRIYKALKDYMADVYRELRRISKAGDIDERLAAVIEILSNEFVGLRGETAASDIDEENAVLFGMGRE